MYAVLLIVLFYIHTYGFYLSIASASILILFNYLYNEVWEDFKFIQIIYLINIIKVQKDLKVTLFTIN